MNCQRPAMNRYEQICAQFYGNRLLFGNPEEAGVVAVEVASATQVEIIRRNKGELTRERRPIKVFSLVADSALLDGFSKSNRVARLEGDFPLQFIVYFDSLDRLDTFRRHLRHLAGKAPGPT